MSVPAPQFDPENDIRYALAKRENGHDNDKKERMRAKTYEKYAMANLTAMGKINGSKKKEKRKDEKMTRNTTNSKTDYSHREVTKVSSGFSHLIFLLV